MSISRTELAFSLFGFLSATASVVMSALQFHHQSEITLAMGLVGATALLIGNKSYLKEHKAVVLPFILSLYLLAFVLGADCLHISREVEGGLIGGAVIAAGVGLYQLMKAFRSTFPPRPAFIELQEH